MTDAVFLTRAYQRAAEWHSAQRRKGQAAEPYINHLVEVASLVAAATEGKEQNLIAAAVLHDSIEDAGISYEIIAGEFNHAVADLVREVTDDKSLPKQIRKRLQVQNAPMKSTGAKFIKLADKTSNLRAILNSPPAWSKGRKKEYLDWARAVVAGTRGTNAWLEAAFDKAAIDLELSLNCEGDS